MKLAVCVTVLSRSMFKDEIWLTLKLPPTDERFAKLAVIAPWLFDARLKLPVTLLRGMLTADR